MTTIVEVQFLPGQEANPLPIWIAKTPAEIALQRESRIRKNLHDSISKTLRQAAAEGALFTRMHLLEGRTEDPDYDYSDYYKELKDEGSVFNGRGDAGY